MPQGLGLSVSSQSDLMVWCVLKLNECLIFIDLKWQSDCLCDLLSINVIVPGKNPTDEYLEAMMMEAPGPINFTMFLTMFGEKLNGTDPEDVIRNAFACFDEEGTGKRSLQFWPSSYPCKRAGHQLAFTHFVVG